MILRRPVLTIFQKMLAAPLVGVLLYSAYLAFAYQEQQASSGAIEEIRGIYSPALQIAGGNIIVFDGIATALKDAVLAGEEEWVNNTGREKATIEFNLMRLEAYAPLVDRAKIEELRAVFRQYYDNAHALSLALLRKNAGAEEMNRLVENVELYHGQASAGFAQMRADLQDGFSQRLDEIHQRLRRQVAIAAGLGVVLVAVIVGITFVMSLSTRNALREVNLALKNMAQDMPDFSRRLSRASRDELGELVGWFNLLSDKLEKDHKKIEQLSITDKLTQLFNRTKIDELFQLEIGKARRYGDGLSVILLDLDHFKAVNDDYGHQVGDRVLRDLADILRRTARDTDHVGRWGGEEFVVLAPNTDLEQARVLAERMRAAIAAYPFGEVGHKTGSFGIASYHDDDDEDSMLQRADECLYAAKNGGRNRVVDERGLYPSEAAA